jgi:hypothetical protein
MHFSRIPAAILALLMLAMVSTAASNQTGPVAQQPLTIIPTTPGGIIEYGVVTGATTLQGAMGSALRQIHEACRERPVVGQVFRVKGTNSAGVFFTVVAHAQNNRQLVGLCIGAQGAGNKMEVAVVADSANRFGQTANGMMQQLFAVWNPAGSAASEEGKPVAAASPAAKPETAAPAADQAAKPEAATPAAPVPLRRVTASDNSAAISIPEGWTLDPVSGHGTILVHGPNGEHLGMDMVKPAVDPTNAWQVQMARGRYTVYGPDTVVYAFRGDLVKEFASVFQAWRKTGGQGPAKIEVEKIEPMTNNSPGGHTVMASGHMDPDGKGMQFFSDLMTVNNPDPQWGTYTVMLHHLLVPSAIAEREKPMTTAVISSYMPNMQVINQQNAALLQQKQQIDQRTLRMGQESVNQIRQIGAQATARMQATESANAAQHAGYWAQQDTNARRSAGFSNYLLDQSVVQNNNVGGTGMVGHSTEWNSVANTMVQANPNKYEIVNTPNYWQGVDY